MDEDRIKEAEGEIHTLREKILKAINAPTWTQCIKILYAAMNRKPHNLPPPQEDNP